MMGKGEREWGREGRWEERYTAFQQGSKILQSVPAQQIEPITERGIFSFRGIPPPLPPHRVCHEALQFADQSAKKERERSAGRKSSI